jgi:hypothetical protein
LNQAIKRQMLDWIEINAGDRDGTFATVTANQYILSPTRAIAFYPIWVHRDPKSNANETVLPVR